MAKEESRVGLSGKLIPVTLKFSQVKLRKMKKDAGIIGKASPEAIVMGWFKYMLYDQV